jgi:replicative DNA helicase
MIELPHNLEAEQAILGALIVDNNDYDLVAPYILSTDFYEPVHGVLYNIISETIMSGKIADGITLINRLKDNQPFQEIGGASYLAVLINGSCDSSTILDYAIMISDDAKRRKMIDAGNELARLSQDTTQGDVTSIIAEHERIILELQSSTKTATQFDAGDMALQFVKDLGNTEKEGAKTYIKDVDEVIGSLRVGQLGIIAGRPSMGKSAFALEVAFNNAIQGLPVAYLSFDMTNDEVVARLLSMAVYNRTGRKITYKDIDRNNLDAHQKAILAEAALWLRSLPITIETKRGLKVPQIISVVRKIRAKYKKEGKKLHLVFIDHLQKIASLKGGSRDTADATNIIESLKDGAQVMGAPVWVLSQLNRAVEGQEDKRPSLKDLRETGAIEQEANLILFVFWEAYYIMRDLPMDKDCAEYQEKSLLLEDAFNKYLILPRKVRSGSIRDVELYVDQTINYFSDKAKTYQQGYY